MDLDFSLQEEEGVVVLALEQQLLLLRQLQPPHQREL